MKQLLEGKICLCNMLINISPHELRSLATQCNMATVLTRASQNLSVCSRSGPVFALSLHSQMKQQRGGKKTTTTKQSRNVSRNLQELWSGNRSSRRETGVVKRNGGKQEDVTVGSAVGNQSGVKKTSRDPPFLFSVVKTQEGAEGNQPAATLKGNRHRTLCLQFHWGSCLDSVCLGHLETVEKRHPCYAEFWQSTVKDKLTRVLDSVVPGHAAAHQRVTGRNVPL